MPNASSKKLRRAVATLLETLETRELLSNGTSGGVESRAGQPARLPDRPQFPASDCDIKRLHLLTDTLVTP